MGWNFIKTRRRLYGKQNTSVRTTLTVKQRPRRLSLLFGVNQEKPDIYYETPCCKHVAHCECFAMWITSSQTIQAVKCAYCRTVFPDVCFMCLKPKNSEDGIVTTYCCHSTLHKQCKKDLQYIVSQLSFDLRIECGQPFCWPLWKKEFST